MIEILKQAGEWSLIIIGGVCFLSFIAFSNVILISEFFARFILWSAYAKG